MSMFAFCYSCCRRTLSFTSSPTAVRSQARTLSALKTFVIASLVLLLLTPGQVSATIAPCNPGPTELLPHASVVTVAKPVSVEIKKENKRYRVLATYEVIEALRGEVGKEVIVESSCADATYTRPEGLAGLGPIAGTYCKGGPKIAPEGFVGEGSTFVPESESSRVVLYLRPGKQGKATTFHDITRERRYYSCREKTYVPDVCGEPQDRDKIVEPYIDTSCPEGFEELVRWIRENKSDFPIEPQYPADPADPADPIDPEDVKETEEPVDPADPADPEDPVDPEDVDRDDANDRTTKSSSSGGGGCASASPSGSAPSVIFLVLLALVARGRRLLQDTDET